MIARYRSAALVALTLLTACGATAGPSLVSAPGEARPERREVRIVYASTSGTAAFLRMATEKDLFRKYGLTVEPQLATASAGVAALLSGEVQLQLAAGAAPVAAIASGAPLRIIANFNRTNSYAIIGRPEMASMTDLKGKAVAIASRGDNTDISLRVALKRHGLVVDQDVSAVQVGGDADRLAALESGQVAGAILDEGAFAGRARLKGMHILVSLRQENIPWLGTGAVVTTSFAKDNPNTVLAALKGLLDGEKFFANENNRAEALEILARDMKLKADDPLVMGAYDFYHKRDGVFPPTEGLDTILDALKSFDPVTYGSLTAEKVADPSFVATLRSSGL